MLDRCFHVDPFDGPFTPPVKDIDTMKVHCLGATSAVYEYDILTLRFSVMQPIPRLLTALFGHALEMGLSLTRIGLADEVSCRIFCLRLIKFIRLSFIFLFCEQNFANLVIERPLQNIAFIAQSAANLWVRNGQMIRNIVGSLLPFVFFLFS